MDPFCKLLVSRFQSHINPFYTQVPIIANARHALRGCSLALLTLSCLTTIAVAIKKERGTTEALRAKLHIIQLEASGVPYPYATRLWQTPSRTGQLREFHERIGSNQLSFSTPLPRPRGLPCAGAPITREAGLRPRTLSQKVRARGGQGHLDPRQCHPASEERCRGIPFARNGVRTAACAGTRTAGGGPFSGGGAPGGARWRSGRRTMAPPLTGRRPRGGGARGSRPSCRAAARG